MPTLTLKDQHEQPQTIGPETRYLIFTTEKDGSALVESVLEGHTEETMASARIRYVADISRMPSLVTTLFALPTLRKRPYPILLGRRTEDTHALPREAGKVTVIAADNGQITAIQFVTNTEALRAAIGLMS